MPGATKKAVPSRASAASVSGTVADRTRVSSFVVTRRRHPSDPRYGYEWPPAYGRRDQLAVSASHLRRSADPRPSNDVESVSGSPLAPDATADPIGRELWTVDHDRLDRER